MRNIFEQDKKAFKYYNKATFCKLLGKVLGIILGTISISYMAIAIPNFGSGHDFAAIGILVTLAYASLFGTLGLVSRSLGLKSMDKAMAIINMLGINSIGMVPENLSINFGINSGGVGLTFNF